MVDIVTLDPMAGSIASGAAAAVVSGLSMLPDDMGTLSYQPILGSIALLPQALIQIMAPRQVAPIVTMSSTTPITGATKFYMRGWDAAAAGFVFWLSDNPDMPPILTEPAALGPITNVIIVGEK